MADTETSSAKANSNDEGVVNQTDASSSTMVQVFTFPPLPYVYNMSPFGIKVESYLRVNSIPYETVYTTKMGSKGMIPYVQLRKTNEEAEEAQVEEIPDSNVILSRLRDDVLDGQDCDGHLSPQQRAVAHAVTRMLEEHTSQIGFYYRYGLHMDEFLDVVDFSHRMCQIDMFPEDGGRMLELMRTRQPENTLEKSRRRGLTRHSDEEIWSFSNDDLRAISDYLGDENKYFFGSSATSIDCAVFGHLSQFMYIPLDFPQKTFLKEECPNVVQFMERFRDTYWPDWETLCAERKTNQRFHDNKSAKH